MPKRIFALLFFLVVFNTIAGAQEERQRRITITPLEEGPSVRTTKIPPGEIDKDQSIIIGQVIIQGNKRTKRRIILRELGLRPGDTVFIQNLDHFKKEKEQDLLNSSLFLSCEIKPVEHGGHLVDLNVEVRERQYFLIVPYLSLADRNFNVWWVKHHHKFNRLNIGGQLYDNNLTGNKDRLGVGFTLGYTQNVNLTYRFPYFDKSLKQGFGIDFAYSRNREISYGLNSNRQLYLNDGQFSRKFLQIGLNYSYRKQVNIEHRAYFSFNNYRIGDSVLKLNPYFFPQPKPVQRYFELDYQFIYRGTDVWAYPLHGFSLNALLSRKGFGLLGNTNETKLVFSTNKYWELSPKTYLRNGLMGSVRMPSKQPYFIFKGMGFNGQYLRGMEYYVAEGNHFAIMSNSLKRRILAFNIHFRNLPKEISDLPVSIYAKAFGDLGYNHAMPPVPPSDKISNRFLYTYGFGLDLISFYDAVLNLEYSFNRFGENGLFLHFKSTF